MSILVVPVRYPPHVGGIETLLGQLLPRLRDRGHDIVVAAGVADDSTGFDEVDGVPVYRLPFFAALATYDPRAILDVSSRLREIESEHDVTLRHVHGLDFNMFFVMRRQQRVPLPLLISVHGTLDLPIPWSPIILRMLREADVVTAVSGAVSESLARHVPSLHGRVPVIRNGIRARQATGESPAGASLFCAGRVDSQKGFDVAIEALARLTRWPAIQLRIAGTGPEQETLRRQAASLGVASRVRFLGLLSPDQVATEMERAAVVLVPSKTVEGFSLVALEAASLGRPVVASDVGGVAETVVDGVTGILTPADNAAALADAVAELLADPQRASEMGREARRLARRFDLDECVDAYSNLYRSHDLDDYAMTGTMGAAEYA